MNEPRTVDLTLLEVSFLHVHRRVIEENFTDFSQPFWHLLFFGLANRFERAVFLDEFQAGLGSDALDARVVVGADHDGEVHQLLSTEFVARKHLAQIDGLGVDHAPVALGAIVHEVANEDG